jgi:hypothetical protein
MVYEKIIKGGGGCAKRRRERGTRAYLRVQIIQNIRAMYFTRSLAIFSMFGRVEETYRVLQTPADVHFALGTLFGGVDVSVMRWGDVTAMHFDAQCTATYAGTPRQAAPPVTQWPPRCAPPCFARGVAFEDDRGILRMTFADRACSEEAARSRVGIWANETNQHRISDDDFIVFETFSV